MARNNLKLEFINGEIYHLYNRGVEKRNIFVDENDNFRFVFSLYECNDLNPVVMRNRIFERKEKKREIYIRPTYANYKRKKLVDVLAFCLMPNHYHLVVRQLIDGGISSFMRKLGDSYVKYFNDKHKRTGMGSLFQGKFKSRLVEDNNQLINLITYVHINPVGINNSDWKNSGIKNVAFAKKFLNNYRWSSYFDYIGETNFPSVTERDFILKIFAASNNNFLEKGRGNMRDFVNGWIISKNKLAKGLSRAY